VKPAPDSTAPSDASRQAPDPGSAKHTRHATAPEDRVPFKEKLSYGVGKVADESGSNGVNLMANPVYNITLGINPGWIGSIVAVQRLFDAVTDPLMGWVSDNVETRFGRRRLWIFIGAILLGITYAAIWWFPRGQSEGFYFTYFLVSSLLFYLTYTMFSVPFKALGLELTPDYHERTVVQSMLMYFSPVALILIQWLFPLSQADFWGDPITGIRWVTTGAAVLFILAGVTAALFTKERAFKRVQRQEKLGFLRTVRVTFGNRNFLAVLAMIVLMLLGLLLVAHLGYYINIYYVFGGDVQAGAVVQGWKGTVSAIATVFWIPGVVAVSRRLGKRRAYMLCLAAVGLSSVGTWWCYRPDLPYLQILPQVVNSLGLAGVFIINPSMLADVCDDDEWQTGHRREAFFAAMQSWVTKFGVSLAFFFSGWILVGTGFEQELGGDQEPGSITAMRLLYAAVPMATTLVCGLIVYLYPLTEDRAWEIRSGLEARRGKVTAAAADAG